MKIDSLMSSAGSDVYYTPAFRVVLESHLTYLMRLPSTKLVTIDPGALYKYEGDLFGLLDSMRIPKQYHWVVMMLNKINSNTDVNIKLTNLLIPNWSEIDKIKEIFLNRKTNL